MEEQEGGGGNSITVHALHEAHRSCDIKKQKGTSDNTSTTQRVCMNMNCTAWAFSPSYLLLYMWGCSVHAEHIMSLIVCWLAGQYCKGVYVKIELNSLYTRPKTLWLARPWIAGGEIWSCCMKWALPEQNSGARPGGCRGIPPLGTRRGDEEAGGRGVKKDGGWRNEW